MKQIGEFAKDNHVTIKALHHYEKLGLITPTKVDDFTGYRYYDENQSNQLKIIAYLKSLGFSLSEIKNLMLSNINKDKLMQQLYAKKKQSLIDLNSTNRRYTQIIALIAILDGSDKNENFNLKEIIDMSDKNDMVQKLSKSDSFNHMASEMFEKAAKKENGLCTLCIDIDKFKSVNDDYGHDVGDLVIKRIMNVLIDCSVELNVNDEKLYSMLEHFAGDEYKIILNDNIKIAEKLAQNILKSVRCIDFNDIADDLSMTVTVGAASNENKTISASHLFHLAESALFEAKVNGKDRYLVYEQ